jgi:putative chitinase
MNIDRKTFFGAYRQRFKALSVSQVDGLDFLLTSIEADAALWSPYQQLSIPVDQGAYLFATVKHETVDLFQPIDEVGGSKYFEQLYGYRTAKGMELGNTQAGEGARYHGRGYVQLTGKANYARATSDLLTHYPELVEKFEKSSNPITRFDLVAHPDQAKEPAIAYAVMSYGMRHGRFTGHKLADYFTATRQDPNGARQIINGHDRAGLIAEYWSGLVMALRAAVVLSEPGAVATG